MTLSLRSVLALTALLAAQIAFATDRAREPLVVFAAASLTDSLQKVTDAYTASSGVQVRLSFAASSALAKQIESGARADVFFSADQKWMDYLDQQQLIATASRKDLLGNRLALIAPHDSAIKLELGPGAPLLAALGERGRLASGDPDSVPVGMYAKAALISLNLWTAVEPKLVRADNVRVALMYVARGETPLGIVYETDAAVEPRVRVVDFFPQGSHLPIRYPVAATASARPQTRSYLNFLDGPAARALFTAAGFKVLPATAPRAACGGECARGARMLVRHSHDAKQAWDESPIALRSDGSRAPGK
jgi:molybdate transport system substrate-binding protein